jgi:glutamyl-Q tRNA(Asp) synthetase
VAALGSYLEAKAHGGLWLVRMEDLDPPREMPGAARMILTTLESLGMHWDGSVLYQSDRGDRYRACLASLRERDLVYACECSRAAIRTSGGMYRGRCRDRALPMDQNKALRLRNDLRISGFQDRLFGQLAWEPQTMEHDFVLRRRDGLWAYQFAVVVDDMDQGITDVVRGADLVESTPRQIALHLLLNNNPPSWTHLPLAVLPDGRKLSKQNRAPALNLSDPQGQLIKALCFLGQDANDQWRQDTPEQLLQLAVQRWRLDRVPKQQQICDTSPG